MESLVFGDVCKINFRVTFSKIENAFDTRRNKKYFAKYYHTRL